MEYEAFRELYLRLIAIYKISPEIAGMLLQRILQILQEETEDDEASGGTEE